MTIKNTQKLNMLIDLVSTIEKDYYNNLSIAQLRILLEVAGDDGILMQSLIDKTGKPQGSISRNVRKLATRMAKDTKGNWANTGLGLLETRQDHYVARNFRVHLTDKGEKFLDKLFKSLGK